MKLNYKRTLLVGLAFFSICAFWQLYDQVVPLMLKNTFHIGDTLAGVIMALDNILALFLLPLFGALSDRCACAWGRRMPFIVCGTAVAVVLIVVLPMADVAANLPAFLTLLGLLLTMGTYRSPAVALMPDLTPKPLRSKGNAMINLMGAAGGMLTLVMIKVLVQSREGVRDDYRPVFAAVAVLMAAAVAVLALTIRERRLAAEAGEESGETPAPAEGGERLSPEARRSLLFILASVALWFMGYNAVTSAFSKYMQAVWGKNVGDSSLCLLVANAGAIVSYLPVGVLSSRFGRKRMIQFGVLLLAVCFGSAVCFAEFSPVLYGMFALVGCAWACINVNSYPMVVELSRGPSVGKYTGYYYTFSMAAQIVTPVLSGFLLENVGYWTLFPYATVMVLASFVTISLSRHGDNRPEPPASRLESFDV